MSDWTSELNKIDWRALVAPFPERDIEWRVQSAGASGDKVWARVLAYVTARAVMQRLDDVIGPPNWRDEYQAGPDGGVLCGLSIRIPGRDEWLTKWDGSENTDVEAVKGGISGALKRAAVKWGIGRYLYELDDGFASVSERGKHFQPPSKTKKGDPVPSFKWDPPALPAWALPLRLTDGPVRVGSVMVYPESAVVEKVTTPPPAPKVLGAPRSMEDLKAIFGAAKTRGELDKLMSEHARLAKFLPAFERNQLKAYCNDLIADLAAALAIDRAEDDARRGK